MKTPTMGPSLDLVRGCQALFVACCSPSLFYCFNKGIKTPKANYVSNIDLSSGSLLSLYSLIPEFLNTSCIKAVATPQVKPIPYMLFEILACGNPTHNLEVVCAPKPTTITLLLAMSIFSQSRLGVCERLPFLSRSVLLSHCNILLTSTLFRHRPSCQ